MSCRLFTLGGKGDGHFSLDQIKKIDLVAFTYGQWAVLATLQVKSGCCKKFEFCARSASY